VVGDLFVALGKGRAGRLHLMAKAGLWHGHVAFTTIVSECRLVWAWGYRAGRQLLVPEPDTTESRRVTEPQDGNGSVI